MASWGYSRRNHGDELARLVRKRIGAPVTHGRPFGQPKTASWGGNSRPVISTREKLSGSPPKRAPLAIVGNKLIQKLLAVCPDSPRRER
jgi:hypothetical protein